MLMQKWNTSEMIFRAMSAKPPGYAQSKVPSFQDQSSSTLELLAPMFAKRCCLAMVWMTGCVIFSADPLSRLGPELMRLPSAAGPKTSWIVNDQHSHSSHMSRTFPQGSCRYSVPIKLLGQPFLRDECYPKCWVLPLQVLLFVGPWAQHAGRQPEGSNGSCECVENQATGTNRTKQLFTNCSNYFGIVHFCLYVYDCIRMYTVFLC